MRPQKLPFRVLFLCKATCAAGTLEPEAHEFMGALRSAPSGAALLRARRALAPDFDMCYRRESDDVERAAGTRVGIFTLSTSGLVVGFEAACERAMRALGLSALSGSSGAPLLARMPPTGDPAFPESSNLTERIDAHKALLAHMLRWGSSELERAALATQVHADSAGRSRAHWL